MPELPEVETTKTSLEPLLYQWVSDVAVYQRQLRWQIPADLNELIGYQLTQLTRRAKYLIVRFEHPQKPPKDVIVHLGMSGSLQQFSQESEKRKHDHLVITFTDNDNQQTLTQLHYHDPRRFGAVLWADDEHDYRHKLFDHLGPEPLTANFTADYLYNYIQNQQKKPITRAIKSVIMEQKVVVGVGNIYATESLFMSGIHPSMSACLVSQEQIVLLVQHIKDILAIAIDKGGSTLRDFTSGDGKTGYFQQTLLVYGKEGQACPTCPTILQSAKINARASVFCVQCQPFVT